MEFDLGRARHRMVQMPKLGMTWQLWGIMILAMLVLAKPAVAQNPPANECTAKRVKAAGSPSLLEGVARSRARAVWI
jgi:hypothetical protein